MGLRRLIPLFFLLPLIAGCCCGLQCISHSCSPRQEHALPQCADLVAEIEYPDVARCGISGNLQSQPPRLLSDGVPESYWDLPLEEAIRIGLQNSDVLKDLGGRVLEAPETVRSVYGPSIVMSHPRLGEEAALASFDARWAQLFTYGDGTQSFNNTTLGGGGTVVDSDFFRTQNELTKTSATGARYSIRSLVEYNNSDAPFNLFPSVYNGAWEATARQPLLQGAGVAFNRIAGPNSNPDLLLTPGVLLARINGDISVADFEKGVRDYVSQLETAYWRLYLAYRSLETNLNARDLARETWQASNARFDAEIQGGQADVEAQAREQLFFFEQQVVLSLNGSQDAITRGVYQAERQLRRMMGLPVNDGNLIRPADEPTDAKIVFDWDGCLFDALTRRVELRQQMWRVKRRELELLAARNFLLPRLDAIATYRVSGFGDDLLGGSGPFSSLGREIGSFENDQYELGFQLNVPIGYRRELAGVRHAELNLCRERAVLRDQEHQVSHNLGDALATLETSFENIRLGYNRLAAAEQVVAARTAIFDAGKSTIENLLEAQRRLAEAQINYYRARVNHVTAITRLHLEKGTLLPYNGINLSEGAWDRRACLQVASEAFRYRPANMNDYRIVCPKVSAGAYQPAIDGTGIAGPAGTPTPAEEPNPAEAAIPAGAEPSEILDAIESPTDSSDPFQTPFEPPLELQPLPEPNRMDRQPTPVLQVEPPARLGVSPATFESSQSTLATESEIIVPTAAYLPKLDQERIADLMRASVADSNTASSTASEPQVSCGEE